MLILITLLTAFVGGALLSLTDIPLAWLLGSMFSVSLVNSTKLELMLPHFLRGFATTIIGIVAGVLIKSPLLYDIPHYAPTLIVMLVSQCLLIAAGYTFFYSRLKADRITAFFASFPGGVSQVSALSLEYSCNQSLIALNHACRLFVVIAFVSLLVGVFLNGAVVHKVEPEPFVLINYCWPIVVAIVGFWLAKKVRLATPALYGPMLVSAGLSLSDVLPETAQVGEGWIIIAQIVIGASIGLKFTIQKKFIKTIVKVHLPFSFLLLIITFLISYSTYLILDIPIRTALMIMAPGGLSEMILISTALNIEPEMVAVHHVVRSFFLLLLIPSVLHILTKTINTSEEQCLKNMQNQR